MLVVIFNVTKKSKLELSQFSLIQIMVTVGLIFLVPQLHEQSIGLDGKTNKAFIFILTYVVIFPAIAVYYCYSNRTYRTQQVIYVYSANATFQCINGDNNF